MIIHPSNAQDKQQIILDCVHHLRDKYSIERIAFELNISPRDLFKMLKKERLDKEREIC